MKYLYYKNLKNRKKFSRNEVILRLLKSVCINENIKYQTRQELFNRINRRFYLSSYTKLNKRCVVTNQSRSVLGKFGVSRIIGREIFNSGLFFGIRKSAW